MNLAKGDLIGSVVGTPGSQKASYMLRVYDGTSGLWVNPAFFIQGLDDRAAPKIMQIALSGQGKTYIADNQKNTAIVIPQGDYTLAIGAFDPSYDSGSVSGVFRLKAVFNGQVVADRKLDSARITERGLAFLELEAPSSSIIDRRGAPSCGQAIRTERETHTGNFRLRLCRQCLRLHVEIHSRVKIHGISIGIAWPGERRVQ